MLRYVFMGSPPIAVDILDHLCKNLYPPIGVVTQEAKPAGRGHKLTPTAVEAYAKQANLPFISTEKISAEPDFSKLAALKPDLLFVVAFGQILKKNVLTLPKLGCLNVHASLLPKYRGAGPVQWALYNGDKETGISIQKMVSALDAGDVLLQRKFPIEPSDTTESLWKKMGVEGALASVEAFRLIESGNAFYTPQDPHAVSLAPKISKEMAEIDWSRSAQEIRNQVRAFIPWPIAQSRLGNETLKIFDCEVLPGGGKTPGEIRTDHQTKLEVTTGHGSLALTEIQLTNRKRLKIQDFLKAYQGSFPFTKFG